MSNTVIIVGASGSGKSTSIRGLDPLSTVIISANDKPLPFRGYKKNYNEEAKNFYHIQDHKKVIGYIRAIDKRRPEIKTLVIDDFNYYMTHEFMNRVMERGYEKYNELAFHAYEMITEITRTREDLTCFILTHSDTDAQGNVKIKTIGKLIDDKICLAGMVTCVLHSQVQDGKYKFLTQHNGTHLAKSPIDMFSEQYIDNDLEFVRQSMTTYFEG